jgi:hypothetical protein
MKRRRWGWAAAVVVVVLIIIGAASGSSKKASQGSSGSSGTTTPNAGTNTAPSVVAANRNLRSACLNLNKADANPSLPASATAPGIRKFGAPCRQVGVVLITTATVPGTSAVVTVPAAAMVPRVQHGTNGHAYYIIARNSKPLALSGDAGAKATAGLVVLAPSRVFWGCDQCTKLPAGGGVIGFVTRGVDVISSADRGSFALKAGAYVGIEVVANGTWAIVVSPDPR